MSSDDFLWRRVRIEPGINPFGSAPNGLIPGSMRTRRHKKSSDDIVRGHDHERHDPSNQSDFRADGQGKPMNAHDVVLARLIGKSKLADFKLPESAVDTGKGFS